MMPDREKVIKGLECCSTPGGNCEVGMTYKRGQVSISVHRLDGFGKNPSLWIGTEEPNQLVKVASFGNKDKANLFCKWLEYLLGFNDEDQAVKWE